MLPWRIFSIGFALVLLAGCGNKGELFLVPTDVSQEELESIDEAIDAIDQEEARTGGQSGGPGDDQSDDQGGARNGDQNDDTEDDKNDDQNDDKKKNNEN